MPSIKGRVIQQGRAIVLIEVNTNFGYMASALQKDKGIAITIDQSYLSKYDVVDELRKIVKDKTVKPPADVRPLLDVNKSMVEILKDGNYDKLEKYLNSLDDVDFEPPLKPVYTSISGINTYPMPGKISTDPRRTAQLVKPGPTDILKSVEVQKWMLNNSPLYGFVLYDDNALYYLGVEKIKSRLKTVPDPQLELQKIIGSFIRTPNIKGLLTTTAQTVIDNKLPNPTIIADPGNLEEIKNVTVKDNYGKIPDLVVIENQPVVRDVALAYLAMQSAAAKEGVTMSLSSGFRPATGPNFNGVTSKGRTISFTTQETLRRDKSRWKMSIRATYSSDNDFVFNAPGSAYNPATAPPNSSRHGYGNAIDVSVGGRDNFQPLNPSLYVWLIKNSYKYGFLRTVRTEEWHFEYLPTEAAKGPYAKVEGTNANKFYSDLGLAKGQFQYQV